MWQTAWQLQRRDESPQEVVSLSNRNGRESCFEPARHWLGSSGDLTAAILRRTPTGVASGFLRKQNMRCEGTVLY